MAINFDNDDISKLPPEEISGDAALHLYDFYYRPLLVAFWAGRREHFGHRMTDNDFFRSWVENTNEGRAYQLIIERSLDPKAVRDYIVRYAS